MRDRLRAIAREAWPALDAWVRAGMRVTVGLALIEVGWPFGGKFLIASAIVGLAAHAEGVVAAHAASKAIVLVRRMR